MVELGFQVFFEIVLSILNLLNTPVIATPQLAAARNVLNGLPSVSEGSRQREYQRHSIQ
jgi:hypothetical protein